MSAAGVLWVLLAVFLFIAALAEAGRTSDPATGTATQGSLAPLFGVGAVALFLLALRMMRGRAARTALTVVGVLSLITLVSVVLVVPAIVLQFLPRSNRWFRDLEAHQPIPSRRPGPPRPPMRPGPPGA